VTDTPTPSLSSITQAARRRYAELLTGSRAHPWWSEVILTASSERQARAYEAEIRQRQEQGMLPAGVPFLVIPDPEGQRLGSGGATVHALRTLAGRLGGKASSATWWGRRRTLVLHSGGDSRRLPQYSPSGKIFSPLPVKGPSGAASTVFDETLALSTLWAARVPAGVVAGSGDVLLIFDADRLDWARPGVSGVGLLQPAEVGSRHGVYVTAPDGRVLSFLQKPSLAECRNAGACRENGRVAVDTGLLRFDPVCAARLCRLLVQAGEHAFDLYYHLPRLLTGQLRSGEGGEWLRRLGDLFAGVAFHCDLVEGEFTHIGTTSLFRHILTEDTDFVRLYSAQQRAGLVAPEGVRSHGVIIDSVVESGTVGPRAVVLESVLRGPVEIGAGAIVHGLEGAREEGLLVPPDTVLHQVPVQGADGLQGVVIRVYGVADDPKQHPPVWLGRPMPELLRELRISEEEVWPGIPETERTLWNAELFPVAGPGAALEASRWFLGLPSSFTLRRWRRLPHASLASSAAMADAASQSEARLRRTRLLWERAAVQLALDGADVRPLLAQAPGIGPLAGVARTLAAGKEDPSRAWLAAMFFAQAGLEEEAAKAREEAFAIIHRRVASPEGRTAAFPRIEGWQRDSLEAAAPARIDLGGGWSDTPPFCFDWGGTVLNAALLLDGAYPVVARLARLAEPVIELLPDAGGMPVRLRSTEALLAPPGPGDPYALARTALRMTGLFERKKPLGRTLQALGGGLRIETAVHLPMGSGLGASSILAAALLQGLAAMGGRPLEPDPLCDLVLELEQRMSTGGGWQDQAGGIYPGMKLLTSSPGTPQRVRCQAVDWSPARRAEFERLLVLAPTGIARVARNLLQQVVGRYLARETAAVQVLHSIKTLALEMAHALREGAWDHLGALLDRHWQLNQILDPHTTNPAIGQLLAEARPLIRGAKLAGAGGGGFFIFLARDEEAAERLRQRFHAPEARLSRRGLVVRT
jgi:fucokinase